jgi:AcrR family transcriptional regulator
VQREQILALAARHFAAHGLDAVRLDDIAASADVARGTLYSHFASKEALVTAIVRPALELASREVREIGACRARIAIDRVVALYLRLWREHADALRVSHRLGRMPPGELAAMHGAFVAGLVQALRPAARAGILRVHEPELAVLVIAHVAVPLLELYASRPDGERLFGDSLRGLLVAD